MKKAHIGIKVLTIDDTSYKLKIVDIDNAKDIQKQIKEFFNAFWIVSKAEMTSDLLGMRIENVRIVETIESEIKINAVHGEIFGGQQ